MMKLSFITDEATQSLTEAIEFAKHNQFSGVELRSVENMPIDQIPAERLRTYRAELDAAELTVCCLASSFYKNSLQNVSDEIDKLHRLCDAADILGCKFIRGFSFFAPESGPHLTEEIIAAFIPAMDILKNRGKTLLLEADPSVNTTNHASLAALLCRLDSPVIAAIFDPGNDIYDPQGEVPYPDGFRAIRPWIRHVHIKDAVLDGHGHPQCVCVGTGMVNYPPLLKDLAAGGYQGWFSLETHYRKNSVISESLMRLPSGAAFSEGGLAATAESAAALRRLLKQVEETQ